MLVDGRIEDATGRKGSGMTKLFVKLMKNSKFTATFAVSLGLLVVLCSVSPILLRAAPPPSQAAHAAHGLNSFAPLNKWKAAVLAGDTTALSSMYGVGADVFAQTPQGKTADLSEETRFWSQFHAMGLTAIETKVLQRTAPEAGVTILTLRVYLTFGADAKKNEMLVSAGQVWLQKGDKWLIVGTQRGDPVPRPILTLPEPATPNTNLYPDPAEAPKDLAAALSAAAKDHKNVIVVFGGNWCYDCHVLDAAFHSRQIAPIVNTNYHVVHVNIGEYNVNTDIARKYDVPLEKGVPAVAVLDSTGKLLTSQQHGEFESAVKIGPADITQFLEHWKPGSAD